CLQWRSQPHSF
nr:immunoglobulin light chain junction region [Macaca mulatta]